MQIADGLVSHHRNNRMENKVDSAGPSRRRDADCVGDGSSFFSSDAPFNRRVSGSLCLGFLFRIVSPKEEVHVRVDVDVLIE